jgi:hypothetical protein
LGDAGHSRGVPHTMKRVAVEVIILKEYLKKGPLAFFPAIRFG